MYNVHNHIVLQILLTCIRVVEVIQLQNLAVQLIVQNLREQHII